ncbi:fumarylacetoacetate hydrolase family protein [Paenibacillus doosanensis]|uniref:fumarylacetoacetate hydrolase family protein n=1 Tax=Paenibacillus doosanensis TaxID=1229154 RepID=UPI0021804D21|nr:fumarylacetoacetate hydrolase family protein [Paenibacillus doosanensis]MCS7462206.1 fumarylacetoacetate hydrolase family protein [Paenibacillus doosanensis]
MRIIRYLQQGEPILAAVTEEQAVHPLEQRELFELVEKADAEGMSVSGWLSREIERRPAIADRMQALTLLAPIAAPEVWAAGVTYERSKEARNYEATGGRLDATTFYDKVYEAERPEIFFKSTAARTVGPGGTVCLRSDSSWQIPEPELGLVIDRRGRIIGYTVGNDMSCRDIEGENPLYLPQAKMWRRSCSIGPAIRLADTVDDPYALDIVCRIYRGDRLAVEGSASTGQLKRRFDELVGFLLRDNEIWDGTVLLTGTCIVPPNEFTLLDGDRIEIEISGIGTLVNYVQTVERVMDNDGNSQSYVS